MLGLNIAQELFLVLFSILYGTMLQTLFGIQSFPLGRTIRGLVKPNGELKTHFEGCGEKSNEWLVRMWRKRIAVSIFFLNILPAVYFFIILNLLSKIPISDFSSFSVSDLVYVLLIFLSALGVIGFNRVYFAIATWKWRSLFCDVAKKLEERGASFDARAQFICGLVYILLPILLLFFVNRCLP